MTRGGIPARGLSEVLTTPCWTICLVMKQIHVSPAWTDLLVQTKQWKRDMRFGAWNVRSLYRPVSLTTVTRELVSSKFDLVGVQEVRWDRGGTVGAGDFIYFLWKRKSSICFILFHLFIYLNTTEL